MAAPSTPGTTLGSIWPLADLRLRTDRLELRVPDDEELVELTAAAADEPYDPAMPMFSGREDTPVERRRRFVQFFWATKGTWTPASWSLSLAAFVDGRPVAMQNARATDFAVLREVTTGSWVRSDLRGTGIGRHMRAAVLQLVFDGLGARYGVSSAYPDNHASLAVSRHFGYLDDGLMRRAVDGEAVDSVRMRLPVERWREHRPDIEVRIEGLAACLPLFGVG